MNVLFVLPLMSVAVIGVISMAGIFDFRKRPLHGYMKSPFESDRSFTPAQKLETGRQMPLAALFEAWTREIGPGEREMDALGFHAAAADSANASCAITRDDELIPQIGGEDSECRRTRGLELPVGRV